MSDQEHLFAPVAVPEHRVVALAGTLAGFRWPGRSFEKLKKPQKSAALSAARGALERLAAEED